MLLVGKGELILYPMDRIFCWNVRGLNQRDKQNEIKRKIEMYQARLVGLLETRVKASKLGALYLNIFFQEGV